MRPGSRGEPEPDGASDLDRTRYEGRLGIEDSDFGKTFSARQARFAGNCEFRKVRFPGADPMAGAQFLQAPTLIDTTLPSIPITGPEAGEEPQTGTSASEKP